MASIQILKADLAEDLRSEHFNFSKIVVKGALHDLSKRQAEIVRDTVSLTQRLVMAAVDTVEVLKKELQEIVNRADEYCNEGPEPAYLRADDYEDDLNEQLDEFHEEAKERIAAAVERVWEQKTKGNAELTAYRWAFACDIGGFALGLASSVAALIASHGATIMQLMGLVKKIAKVAIMINQFLRSLEQTRREIEKQANKLADDFADVKEQWADLSDLCELDCDAFQEGMKEFKKLAKGTATPPNGVLRSTIKADLSTLEKSISNMKKKSKGLAKLAREFQAKNEVLDRSSTKLMKQAEAMMQKIEASDDDRLNEQLGSNVTELLDQMIEIHKQFEENNDYIAQVLEDLDVFEDRLQEGTVKKVGMLLLAIVKKIGGLVVEDVYGVQISAATAALEVGLNRLRRNA